MSTNVDSQRFQHGADKYASYLDTPKGRLRLDLAFANLHEFLLQSKLPLRALDLGSGTGAAGIRLAGLGFHVTLLDSSSEMLRNAKRSAEVEGVIARIELKQSDAAQAAELLQGQRFSVIVCHNLLEYVADPAAVLRAAAALMRDSRALLSVLVRNRAGEVLKAAIQSGDLDAAENKISDQWGHESLYGGRVRLFTPDEVLAMLQEVGLAIIACRGVRVVSDYLPVQISRQAECQRIFALERRLGQQPEFAAVARYTQFLARRSAPVVKDGA